MRRAFILPVLLALAGCAALPQAPRAPAVRGERDTIQEFLVEGRIAVRHGEQNFTARLSWQHAPRAEDFVLSTPLGQGVARLTADEHGATLVTADQKRYAARDLDSLSENMFGVRLPVSALPDWIVGRRADRGAAEVDSLGRLLRLREQGWVIDYAEYENDSANALPTLVRLTQNDTRVQLKIDEWLLAP